MKTRMVVESRKPRCRSTLDRRMGVNHTDTCWRSAGHHGWHGGQRYRWDDRLSTVRGTGRSVGEGDPK